MGEMQAGRQCVLRRAILFCSEILGPGIHVSVTFTCTTYLNSVADQDSPPKDLVESMSGEIIAVFRGTSEAYTILGLWF